MALIAAHLNAGVFLVVSVAIGIASFFCSVSRFGLAVLDGPQLDTASALLSLQRGCGLWTPSCDFVSHN